MQNVLSLTLHVYDLTCISGGGGNGGGVTGEKAAKPVTAAQDWVSTFVNVTQLDILKETTEQFSSSVNHENWTQTKSKDTT